MSPRPDVELGDPPDARPGRRPRWTIGRVATDLAVVAVAVPVGLHALAGPRIRGECGTTLDNFAALAGLTFLASRLAWIPLKALNDAAERWLDLPNRPDP